MAGYTKEFLVAAFISRYVDVAENTFEALVDMADGFYDEVGRDKFRVYCSLDAEALRKYRLEYAA